MIAPAIGAALIGGGASLLSSLFGGGGGDNAASKAAVNVQKGQAAIGADRLAQTASLRDRIHQ